MIASLKGIVDSLGAEWAVIDVGGVGYLVFCSSRTLAGLDVGEIVSLKIETHVREDHIHLYGFREDAEKEWFKLLTTVQGVGMKVGLGLLSALSGDELVQAIVSGDKTTICRANGVGPKLGARIISELKDKVGSMALGPVVHGETAVAGAMSNGAAADAISALSNLGYNTGQAQAAISRAMNELGSDAGVEDLIRAGLKELSR